MAGNSAAANEDGLIYDVMTAFYTACGSFIGQNYGARKKERIKKSFLLSLAYSFGAGLFLGLAILAAGPAFLSLFTKDAAVVEAGMQRLAIMSVSYGVSAFMDCTIAASRGSWKKPGADDHRHSGLLRVRIAWIYTVFAYFQTVPSLYLLYLFSWTITAAAEIAYFIHVYRKELSAL